MNIRIDMREKLILIFLGVKVIPLIFVTVLALSQIGELGMLLGEIAVTDSTVALNNNATESIERLSTDTANSVARFLYDRDDDLRYLASLEPTQENYERFIQSRTGDLARRGRWELSEGGESWISAEDPPAPLDGGISTNRENEDEDKFHYRPPDQIVYESVLLYDEITFVDLRGMEQVKVVRPSARKEHYPLDPAKKDVSRKENTYVKAEQYFDAVKAMKPGEIYVSDVVGAY
ncbi:MAG: hybrid sensor histidine kinase/response regulator, partial [Clostridia bacterium]|nr:hybrid sensor histidine kinase/response regulator [Clostridia bacterium]